jgi:hypothetical protein
MEETLVFLKEKLVERGFTEHCIPKALDDLSKRNPHVICNKIADELLNEISQLSSLGVTVHHYLHSIHEDIRNFFSYGIKKGDILLVTHCMKGKYFTSVVEFKYEYDGAIIFERPKRTPVEFPPYATIECGNVIAVARIPSGNNVAKRFVVDNDYSLFIKIADKVFS